MTSKEEKIIDIPINEIVPNKIQKIIIRDPEKFQKLKDDMDKNGQNQPIVVRELSEKKKECIIGHGRTEAAKQLGWKTIKAIIVELDDLKAIERCVIDNLCRSDYTPTQLEDLIYELMQTGRYSSNNKLANALGFSGAWVGKLLESRKTRKEISQKYKVTLDDRISAQDICEAKSVDNLDDTAALLKQLQEGKIKKGEVKTVVNILKTVTEKEKNSILYKGVSYHIYKAKYEHIAKKQVKKGSKKSIISSNESIDIHYLYEFLNATLPTYFAGIEDKKLKKKMLNHLKVIGALILDLLKNERELTDKQYTTFVENILGVKIDIHTYDGGSLTGLRGFYDENTTNIEDRNPDDLF